MLMAKIGISVYEYYIGCTFCVQVRTKDRIFDSVSHLVNHHCDNTLPIISADSALVLRYPVPRRTDY